MILVHIPEENKTKLKWVFHVVFSEWLKLDYEIIVDKRENIQISYNNKTTLWKTGKTINYKEKKELSSLSVNTYEFKVDGAECIKIKLFQENQLEIIAKRSNITYVDYEFFDWIYLFLSGEIDQISSSYDEHQRAVYRGSFHEDMKIIDDPIVDEYVELIENLIDEKTNRDGNSRNEYKINITCDIDTPYLFGRNGLIDLKIIIRAILKLDFRLIMSYILTNIISKSYDPYYAALRYIIKVNKEHKNNNLTFFCIPKVTDKRYDGEYLNPSKDYEKFKALIKKSKWAIGVHPGYKAGTNSKEMCMSIQEFRRIFSEQDTIRARMHYLRWNSAVTPELLARYGVTNDSTVMFPDRCGFKAGTCREYPMYDFTGNRVLSIRQSPLLIMDNTLFEPDYMNLSATDAVIIFENYKSKVKKFGGIFTVLWHNSSLTKKYQRHLYQKLIKY